MTEVQDKKWLT